MAEQNVASSGDGSIQELFAKEDMQGKKLTQIFMWFDQNGDGFITKDDFEKSAQVFTALAVDTDEKNKSTMREGLMKWWRLLLDAREDKTSESLSRDEYIRIMKGVVVAPQNFEITIGTVVDGMLGALDTDGNGTLSQGEYLEMYKRLGVSHERLGVSQNASIEAFKRLDRDSNGEITHDELQKAIVEFFTSPDPNAPGQWLLGPPHELTT